MFTDTFIKLNIANDIDIDISIDIDIDIGINDAIEIVIDV